MVKTFILCKVKFVMSYLHHEVKMFVFMNPPAITRPPMRQGNLHYIYIFKLFNLRKRVKGTSVCRHNKHMCDITE